MQNDTNIPNKLINRIGFKSFLLAVLIAVIFFIWCYLSLRGHSIYAILYSPIVFVISWLYFYFLLLLWFSNALKLYIISTTAVMILCLISSGFYDLDIKIKNLFHDSSPPKEYNSFQELNTEPVVFGDHKISLFINSKNHFDTYINDKAELIMFYNEVFDTQNDSSTFSKFSFFKYNPSGDLVDSSIHIIQGYTKQKFLEGYWFLVEGNKYSTWAIDNDTTLKNIEVLNEFLDWSQSDVYDQMNNIIKKATYYYVSFDNYLNDANGSTNYTKDYFYQDGKWHVFYLPRHTKIDYDFNTYYAKGRTVYDIFKYKVQNSSYDYNSLPAPDNLITLYYQKLNYGRDRFNEIMYKYDQGESWDGYLYSKLWLGSDTLRFKNRFFWMNNGSSLILKLMEKKLDL